MGTSQATLRGLRWLTGALVPWVGLWGAGCANTEARPLAAPAHVPVVPRPPASPEDALDALLRRTVTEWNEAHDEHDRKRLEALYDSRLRYGRFAFTRDDLLRLKEASFARAPSARHSLSDLRLDRTVVGLPQVRFQRTELAMNRIQSTEVHLTLSCDRKVCLVVAEDDAAFAAGLSRGAALATRPGSCPEALVALVASVKDAKKVLAGRAPADVVVPIAFPPDSPRYTVVILAPGSGTDAPAVSAVYDLAPGTLDITEALPGDVPHVGDGAAHEHAKRACTSR